MERRDFLRAIGLVVGGAIIVPGFGRFFREGSGLYVPTRTDNDLTTFEIDWSARELTVNLSEPFWSRAVEDDVRALLSHYKPVVETWDMLPSTPVHFQWRHQAR